MKYNSKKGFTLIESITYLSISMIVTLLAIHLLIDILFNFKRKHENEYDR